MGTTLLKLEQETLTGYKPRLYANGTTSGNGSTSLFIDQFRTEPDGEWDRVDTYVKFTNGLGVASVNLGIVRRITGFSAMPSGNYSLTFMPALTASVPSGTTYDLYKNFNPSTDLIQSVNSSVRDLFGARSVYNVATTYEPSGGRDVSVPSSVGNTITRLIRVERAVATVFGTTDPWFTLVEGTDYNVTDYSGTQVITLNYQTVGSTMLRLTGIRPPSDLVNDSDIIEEPAHLIELGARKFLALQEGDQSAADRWGRELTLAKREYFRARQNEDTGVPRFSVGATWNPNGYPWWP